MLSKKVARAQFGKAEPYKKVEFPRLSDYALTVVAANFQLYPALTDVPPQVKDKVTSSRVYKHNVTLPFFVDH